MSVDLGPEHLPFHLTSLLRAVYRELVATEPTAAGEGLQSLAQEVVEEMKKTCGREVFSGAYAEVHQLVLRNREERRKKAALEVLNEGWRGSCVIVGTFMIDSLVITYRLSLTQRRASGGNTRRTS